MEKWKNRSMSLLEFLLVFLIVQLSTSSSSSSSPSITSITHDSYLLDVTVFFNVPEKTKTYTFEVTIFDIEFDRDVYVETFNGSYSYSNISDTYFSPNTEIVRMSCGSSSGSNNNKKTRLDDPHLEADWRLVPEAQASENWIHSTVFEIRKNRKKSKATFSVSVLESVEYGNKKNRIVLKNPAMSHQKNCTLRFLSSSEQTSWPIYNIVDRLAQPIPTYSFHQILLSSDDISRTLHKILITDRNLREAVPERKRSAMAHRKFEHYYPSVSSSWNPIVPPMPNYCGLEDGALSVQDAMDLRIHHEISFIESSQKMTTGIPLLSEILEFVVKLILPPIFNPFTARLTDHLISHLGSTMSDQAGSEAPYVYLPLSLSLSLTHTQTHTHTHTEVML